MKMNNIVSHVCSSLTPTGIRATTINGRLPMTHLIELMRNMEVTVTPVYGGSLASSDMFVTAGCKTPFTERNCREIETTAVRDGDNRIAKLRSLTDTPHPAFITHVGGPASLVFFTATSTQWDTVVSRLDKHNWGEMRWVAAAIKETIDKKQPNKIDNDVWHCPYIYEEDLDPIFDVTKKIIMRLDIKTISSEELTEDCFNTMAKVSVMRTLNPLVLRTHFEHSAKAIELDIAAYSALEDSGAVFNIDAMRHQLLPDTISEDTWDNGHLHGNTPGMIQFSCVQAWDTWRKREVTAPAA